MKPLLTQSIAFVALIVIALIAGRATAGNPFSNPSAAFPNGNTPFPVTVGSYAQIKGAGAPPAPGGGLVIGGSFVAQKNASFDKNVGIQGILTGNPSLDCAGNTSSINNLCFGAASENNVVDVNTTGTTYATNGGLYAPTESAPTGKNQTLCANQQGEIIICPGSMPTTPPPTIYGTLTGSGRTVTVTLNSPAPASVTFSLIESEFTANGYTVSQTTSISIPANGTTASSTVASGLSYSCTTASNPPNLFVQSSGAMQYRLTITNPCP